MTKQDLNERVKKVRTAFDNGDMNSIEFYADGSGVNFIFDYQNECYNRKEVQSLSIPMYAAILCLQGYRCKQHDSVICY